MNESFLQKISKPIKNSLRKEDASEDENYSDKVAYITDIHLLHRYDLYQCETSEDRQFVIQNIAEKIGGFLPKTKIKLLGGDISSNFNEYQAFISALSPYANKDYWDASDFFFTLGNHDLWSFPEEDFSSIENRYRELLSKHRMHLVQNNLYYYDNYYFSLKEITAEELQRIDETELRAKLRSAWLIIFGGVGFSGQNQEFNAENGIYRGVLSREQEILESRKFEALYNKVAHALFDKNVIIFTHMPMKDWAKTSDIAKGFVYVNGHNHRNFFHDDGNVRIYADNQIGYKQKNLQMKYFSINMSYDWFSDYQDGIYEITRDDYIIFYRGLSEGNITFRRDFEHLYMIKREGIYMFFLVNKKGELKILSKGSIKNAGDHALEYYYDNLVSYSRSIKMFLSQYDALQKSISKAIIDIGGEGRIHGCIVDIDFFNHLYINPLDGQMVAYYADSMINKYVYNNLPSLLKNKCPKLFLAYKEKVLGSKDLSAIVPFVENQALSNKSIYVESTEMYRISNIILRLQFTTKYGVVRIWNDYFAKDPSRENGRFIVRGIIAPATLEDKTSQRTDFQASPVEDKKKREATIPPEHKIDWAKKERKYKVHVESMTKTIEVVAYNGATIKSEYKCKLCGYSWKEKADRFKLHPICPSCKK